MGVIIFLLALAAVEFYRFGKTRIGNHLLYGLWNLACAALTGYLGKGL